MKRLTTTLIAVVALGAVYKYVTYPFKGILRQKHNFVSLTNFQGNSGGSGWAVKTVTGNLYTVTNAHVCDGVGDAEGYVYGHDYSQPDRTARLRIIEVSPNTDLCLVEPMPKATGFTVAEVGPLTDEKLLAVGYPALEPVQPAYGIALVLTEANVLLPTPIDKCNLPKHKIVEQSVDFFGITITRQLCTESFMAIITTVPIFPGSSGSAVFNASGEVVGVMFAGGRTNHGMMISHHDLVDFLGIR